MSPGEIAMCAVFALTLPTGQLLFKWAADYQAPPRETIAARLASHWRLGLACGWYGLTALFWFFVLTLVPLSEAYPFAIAGSALVPLAAALVFREPVSWRYAAGYALLLAGLALAIRGAA